jgi:hypothetical protein
VHASWVIPGDLTETRSHLPTSFSLTALAPEESHDVRKIASMVAAMVPSDLPAQRTALAPSDRNAFQAVL